MKKSSFSVKSIAIIMQRDRYRKKPNVEAEETRFSTAIG